MYPVNHNMADRNMAKLKQLYFCIDLRRNVAFLVSKIKLLAAGYVPSTGLLFHLYQLN